MSVCVRVYFMYFSFAQHNIPCIDFDPSGHLLASISIDRTVRVWDIERAEMLAQRRIDIHWYALLVYP